MVKLKNFLLRDKAWVIAFLLPFLFYGGVFFGKSFGLECATGVMGFKPPYQQSVTEPNKFCGHWADVGAYAWQHVPQGIKVGMEYANFQIPIWNQNSGIGVPLAANFISTAFFPLIIPFLLFKSIFVFDLFIIFRMSIAALGMYLFVRSLGLPKPLALIGSLLIFLNGYMTMLPSISHQSVDILLPWIGYFITTAAKEGFLKYFVLLAVVTAISHLGANPESSVFVALFYALYAGFLVVFVHRERLFNLLILFSSAFILSFAPAAILIIPGMEFIAHSSSLHETNILQLYSAPFFNTVFFIYPYVLGLLRNQAYSEVTTWMTPNYIGSFFSFFLILSIFLILELKTKIKQFLNWKYYLFFISFLLLLLVQYFNIFSVPIFTKLPGFSQTNYPKYSLSLINLLIALIVPFSIYYQQELVRGAKTIGERFSRSFPTILTYITFLLITLVVFRLLGPIATKYLFYDRFKLQLLFSVGIVSTIFVISFLRNTKIKYIVFFALASLELFIFLPYLRGDAQRRDTLRKPPALSFLQERDYRETRIFSPDYILYPDFSAAFDINDARDLNALWPRNYYNYLKEFVVPEIDKAAFRFTGLRESGANTDARFVDNPFFDLLSVKYILAYNDVNAYEDLQNLIPYLQQSVETPSLRSDVFNIQNISRPVIFEHAPGEVKLTINRPKGASYFQLYPALSEKIFNVKDSGDGVRFAAKASIGEAILFEKELTINPKNNMGDQKWFEMTFGPFPEGVKQFDLILQTDPLKTNINDWSGWGGFVWDTELSQPKNYQFKKIYDKEMKIYENKNFIPRLHTVNEIKCAQNEDEVLNKMRSNETTIKNIGIVLANNCSERQLDGQNVTISNAKFDDQKITFNYSSIQGAYVILSNLFYPGWKLKVNGKEIPIQRVNYTFQGLPLPDAENAKVEIIYDPDSFKLGLGITLLSLLISLAVLWKFPNKKVDEIFKINRGR